MMFYILLLLYQKMFVLDYRDLSVGRGSTSAVGGGALPNIHAVEAWDGKDGQVRLL